MAEQDYISKFEELVLLLEMTKNAYESAPVEGKALLELEMMVLKNRILAITHPHRDPEQPVISAELSEAEKARLTILHQLKILDTPFEPLFDSIALLAGHICNKPIALISLVDEDRQWFKANVGLEGTSETPRDQAFCAHTILQDDILEIPDATLDPRFSNNPLVRDKPDIRFYAGAPLLLDNGAALGSICVIDRVPGKLSQQQRDALKWLAKIVSEALILRHALMPPQDS